MQGYFNVHLQFQVVGMLLIADIFFMLDRAGSQQLATEQSLDSSAILSGDLLTTALG